MQIEDQLREHAKSELETDVAIETAGSTSVDSWLGSSAQTELEVKGLESLEEEGPKAAQDKDGDDLIENEHSLKEMDNGDVLAYSGEISGEFKSTESPSKPSGSKETSSSKTINLS